MTYRAPNVTRRGLLAGFGATSLGLAAPSLVRAQSPSSRRAITLRAGPESLALRPDQPPPQVWSLQCPELRFDRGDELAVSFSNALPEPAVLSWRGVDAATNAEPLASRRPLAPGAGESFTLALPHAGTFLCDARLLGDGQAAPASARALIVREREPVAVDRDEVMLIEDWRLRTDGSAIAPGTPATDATTLYTVNGRAALELSVRRNSRFRLRFINSCQRNIIAIKIDEVELRVMAIDGQPAEPFLARGGQLVLAPGTRIDAFVDAPRVAESRSAIMLHDGVEARSIGQLVTSSEPPLRSAPLDPPAPLPSNGLPLQLDLKGALRIDLPLTATAPWLAPLGWTAATAPLFRCKRGRTVVLALVNAGAQPMVFHLHGHHFRLLDRLDDGWKPFWLDTLVVPGQQTLRIAFAAEHAGTWLVEAMAAQWPAPRLVQSYAVG